MLYANLQRTDHDHAQPQKPARRTVVAPHQLRSWVNTSSTRQSMKSIANVLTNFATMPSLKRRWTRDMRSFPQETKVPAASCSRSNHLQESVLDHHTRNQDLSSSRMRTVSWDVFSLGHPIGSPWSRWVTLDHLLGKGMYVLYHGKLAYAYLLDDVSYDPTSSEDFANSAMTSCFVTNNSFISEELRCSQLPFHPFFPLFFHQSLCFKKRMWRGCVGL